MCLRAETWLPDELVRHTADLHVVIAMSGGVDSSVAALSVKRAGLKCSALFMKNWNEPSDDGHCQWEDDVADALGVCERLDIPINTVDLSRTYWDTVFEDFLTQYQKGRTPNPDVLCNREIKFKAFLECAKAVGGNVIATGHYVASDVHHGCRRLLKGADATKDQSYFLYTLGQAQLSASIFPLGTAQKSDVRSLARDAGLGTHEKKDSTGICFIGEQRFRDFLSQFIPAVPGPIVTIGGDVVGEHYGAVYYTLGQRQGLGIGGVKGAGEVPWFVAAKNLESNELTVVQGHDHPALMSTRLTASDMNWVAGVEPKTPFRCKAKTRYRQADQDCTIESILKGVARLRFDQPQRAVTPGQSVVFYDGNACVGGGIIDVTT